MQQQNQFTGQQSTQLDSRQAKYMVPAPQQSDSDNVQVNVQFSQGMNPGFSQPQNYAPVNYGPLQQPIGFQQQPIGFQQQPIGIQQFPVQNTYQPIPQQNFQQMPGPQNYNPIPQVIIVRQNQEDSNIPVNISNTRASSYFRCLKCGFKGMTKIEYKMGCFSWMMVLLLLVYFFPFACLPCCLAGMKDVVHHCPQCNAEVGRFCLGQPEQ